MKKEILRTEGLSPFLVESPLFPTKFDNDFGQV